MPNTFFHFKQFTVNQDKCAMKVCTDACILGAWAADQVKDEDLSSILDIGCGTGLLSLMLAQKISCSIDCIEINADAASQAMHNIAASPWKDRIQVYHTSLQEFIPAKKYDLIICNPPFYEDNLRSTDNNKNDARHDTALTLNELSFFAAKYLSGQGKLVVLLPMHRTNYFEKEANTRLLFIQKKMRIRQTPSHENFRCIMILSKKEKKNSEISELIIHDHEKKYTKVFSELLKDYYLKL